MHGVKRASSAHRHFLAAGHGSMLARVGGAGLDPDRMMHVRQELSSLITALPAPACSSSAPHAAVSALLPPGVALCAADPNRVEGTRSCVRPVRGTPSHTRRSP